MKLPKEWEAIVGDVIGDVFGVNGQGAGDAIKVAVERCYALTQKPRKELTDAELCKAYDKPPGINMEHTARLRAVIAAHEAKQREPETVTFRAARLGDSVEMFRVDPPHIIESRMSPWEWIEPPQTFEVKV